MKKKPYSATTDAHHSVIPSLAPLIITGVLYWVPVTIFAKLAIEIREKEPIALDSQILLQFLRISNSWLDSIALATTLMGDMWFIALVTVVSVAYVLYLGHKKDALLLAVGVGGVAIINMLLKVVFQRTRPNLWHPLVAENSYSFPSGHAMASSALALSFVIIFWRTRYRWLVFVIASSYVLAVGLSRLYLGVHYPTDIIAGWCVSLVWVLLVRKIIVSFSRSKTYRNMRKVH